MVRKGVTHSKGYTTIFNVLEFLKTLEIAGLRVLYPVQRDYDEAVRISAKLLNIGKPIPAVDILIAAICVNRKLSLNTKDEHFLNVKSVNEEFRLNLLK